MGYELHITKQKDWFDFDPHLTIDPEEWIKYANNDPDLTSMLENGRFFFIYNKDEEEWIEWLDGNINSKNPSISLRRKMYQIAYHFKAHVQGDEGEIYGKNGEVKEKINYKYWFFLVFLITLINLIRYI